MNPYLDIAITVGWLLVGSAVLGAAGWFICEVIDWALENLDG